jgi:hypothetical protein
MSGGKEVDGRTCAKCGRARASVMEREGGQTQIYYEGRVCDPPPRRATGISTISSYYFPAPSHAPPPGAPVAGP